VQGAFEIPEKKLSAVPEDDTLTLVGYFIDKRV